MGGDPRSWKPVEPERWERSADDHRHRRNADRWVELINKRILPLILVVGTVAYLTGSFWR